MCDKGHYTEIRSCVYELRALAVAHLYLYMYTHVEDVAELKQ